MLDPVQPLEYETGLFFWHTWRADPGKFAELLQKRFYLFLTDWQLFLHFAINLWKTVQLKNGI